MLLQYPTLAAKKFGHYAYMSALAYQEHESCEIDEPESQADRELLASELKIKGWLKVFDSQSNGCQFAQGLAFHVWINKSEQQAVIAFRGTQGTTDWWYGNLKSALWYDADNQYRVAREQVESAITFLQMRYPLEQYRLFTTGHSLGGGLAQHIYYLRDDVEQVFAFDPSPITGFLALKNSEIVSEKHLIERCQCNMDKPFEARIYRIYESSEVLAYLRFPVKVVNPITRHIQEVRFGFSSGSGVSQHGMLPLALKLKQLAESDTDEIPKNVKWYEGLDKSFTEQFEFAQYSSCLKTKHDEICPI